MMNNQKGITLVALVITIIILLILAGISISQLVGSGLFEKAKQAADKTEDSQNLENSILGDYESSINEYLSGIQSGDGEIKTIAEAQSSEMLKKTINTKVQDAYGNQIVVPAGFKITNDATTVNNGIVIIDSNENEFVWIPVPTDGKVYTNADRTQFKIIQLNRYTFDANGVKTVQNDNIIGSYYQELAISDKGNVSAKDINKFKKSVETNKGYYIGRFEARKTSSNELTLKAGDSIYNNITQPLAAEKCRNMYDNTKPFTSDLMNSYAWDTATLFLQECGTNPMYSRQNSINTTLATTGTNNQTTKDVQCNVYDMAGNILEWVTENSSRSGEPCVIRGGRCSYSGTYTIFRDDEIVSYSSATCGFRPIIYI